jgi:hypothetical protein
MGLEPVGAEAKRTLGRGPHRVTGALSMGDHGQSGPVEENEFQGMARTPVSLTALVETRQRLRREL